MTNDVEARAREVADAQRIVRVLASNQRHLILTAPSMVSGRFVVDTRGEARAHSVKVIDAIGLLDPHTKNSALLSPLGVAVRAILESAPDA